MAGITLQSITRDFGATRAVDRVDLAIEPGELFFLLGPSGCGKTTLLRMIAGFTEPTAGRILFGSRDVTALPPEKRRAGMVFQSYALWPHMTVAENVAYGLKVRSVGAAERAERVRTALATVQMGEYAERRPNQLSGGQQQRVALARALVVEPEVLLLDEPLSNLDAKLRLEMRVEIRRICKAAGITGVYVTHDQKEALSMADRIAVLERGRIVQVGAPRELYDFPKSRFVADFLGETNFVPVTARDADGTLRTPAGPLRTVHAAPDAARLVCSIRPEALRLVGAARAPDGAANRIAGRCVQSIYLGEMSQHVVEVAADCRLKVFEPNPGVHADLPAPGTPMSLLVDPTQVVVLPET